MLPLGTLKYLIPSEPYLWKSYFSDSGYLWAL